MNPTPEQALTFVDSIICSQRLTLTVVEFDQLVKSMKLLKEFITKEKTDENIIRPATP